MNLANKQCYPIIKLKMRGGVYEINSSEGLTFRERLIVALASNPLIFQYTPEGDPQTHINTDRNARIVINQADAIIKQLEEKK